MKEIFFLVLYSLKYLKSIFNVLKMVFRPFVQTQPI